MLYAIAFALLLFASPVLARCDSCPRDAYGRIKRSAAAVHRFEKMTGFPHGRKGWIVDHWCALSEGGADEPSNMRWQSIEDAKAKDKIERLPGEKFCSTPCPDCGAKESHGRLDAK